jgi:hypothetical protein
MIDQRRRKKKCVKYTKITGTSILSCSVLMEQFDGLQNRFIKSLTTPNT